MLFLSWPSKQFLYTTCSELVLFSYWSRNSMNNLCSYCGLTDERMSASEKDLPVTTNYIYKLQCKIGYTCTNLYSNVACLKSLLDFWACISSIEEKWFWKDKTSMKHAAESMNKNTNKVSVSTWRHFRFLLFWNPQVPGPHYQGIHPHQDRTPQKVG